jgi:hypothetical protein
VNGNGEVIFSGRDGIVYFNDILDEILNVKGVYKKKWMGTGQIASTTTPFRFFNE